MDSLFNLVILLIPLAIFIGRFVVQARNKRAPPPPQPRIPVHFEDDDDEDEFFSPSLSRKAPEVRKAPQKRESPKPLLVDTVPQWDTRPQPVVTVASLPKAAPARAKAETPPAQTKGLPLNLENLSPLKQAVVMAEILGPPKGM